MASNYFNTDQVLETVLLDGSDLEDEESVKEVLAIWRVKVIWKIVLFVRKLEVFLTEGSIQPLPPCDRPSFASKGGKRQKFVFILSHFLDNV